MSKKDKQEQLSDAQPKKAKISLDGQYPGLNGISWAIGYLEQFLAVISEPLLIGCAALAVIDFITGGHLMEVAFINYTWAASLAIAVTACFIVTWRRSIRAFGYNRYGAGVFLGCLGILLGLVDFAAIAVQTLQQTLTISFAQALTMLNLNVVAMTYIRSIVAIAMAVVVAVSNNTAITTAQAPKRRLAFLDKALNKFAPVVSSEQTLSAQIGASPAQVVSTQEPEPPVKRLETKQPARLHIVEPGLQLSTIEQAMYDALMSNPEDAKELARIAQENSMEDFIALLKVRYSQYAEYITPARVARVKQRLEREQASHASEQSPLERVKRVLNERPECSDRRLGALTNLAPATAKKYRQLLNQQRSEVIS